MRPMLKTIYVFLAIFTIGIALRTNCEIRIENPGIQEAQEDLDNLYQLHWDPAHTGDRFTYLKNLYNTLKAHLPGFDDRLFRTDVALSEAKNYKKNTSKRIREAVRDYVSQTQFSLKNMLTANEADNFTAMFIFAHKVLSTGKKFENNTLQALFKAQRNISIQDIPMPAKTCQNMFEVFAALKALNKNEYVYYLNPEFKILEHLAHEKGKIYAAPLTKDGDSPSPNLYALIVERSEDTKGYYISYDDLVREDKNKEGVNIKTLQDLSKIRRANITTTDNLSEALCIDTQNTKKLTRVEDTYTITGDRIPLMSMSKQESKTIEEINNKYHKDKYYRITPEIEFDVIGNQQIIEAKSGVSDLIRQDLSSQLKKQEAFRLLIANNASKDIASCFYVEKAQERAYLPIGNYDAGIICELPGSKDIMQKEPNLRDIIEKFDKNKPVVAYVSEPNIISLIGGADALPAFLYKTPGQIDVYDYIHSEYGRKLSLSDYRVYFIPSMRVEEPKSRNGESGGDGTEDKEPKSRNGESGSDGTEDDTDG